MMQTYEENMSHLQVPFGPVERKKNRNRGLAAMYRRGTPSGFHTITWWASGATGVMSETEPVTTPAIDFFRITGAQPTFPTEDCGIQAVLRDAKGRGTFAPRRTPSRSPSSTTAT